MSEWWSVVAVFWALYLADGVSGGRRERLYLSSWSGGAKWRFWRWRCPRVRWRWWRKNPAHAGSAVVRRVQPARTAHLTQAGWHFTPPFPWAYTLALDDLPGGLAAEGLTNWPAASTSRPPPFPDAPGAARWENLDKVGVAGGWITLGGARFTPVTTALDASTLRRLAERLGPLSPAQRAAELARWQRRHFSVLRARRRLAVGLARTRGLAWMNTLQSAGWAALSVALVRGTFDPALPFSPTGSWQYLERGQLGWWILSGWLALSHLLAVGTAWRLHRKLHPRRSDERSSLIFSALLLPAQALRFRAALLRPLARGLAPLAATLAVGTPETARKAAAATLRDVDFPVRPPGLPTAVATLSEASAALARPAIEHALADAHEGGVAGLRPEELLAPPPKLEPGVCAYCPRCGDGFLRADGVCPQGVALRATSAAPLAAGAAPLAAPHAAPRADPPKSRPPAKTG